MSSKKGMELLTWALYGNDFVRATRARRISTWKHKKFRKSRVVAAKVAAG
jgi:hypothetical protein